MYWLITFSPKKYSSEHQLINKRHLDVPHIKQTGTKKKMQKLMASLWQQLQFAQGGETEMF